jgi:hypothetical protein
MGLLYYNFKALPVTGS